MRVLLTGATGKLGGALLPMLAAAMARSGGGIAALCHNRALHGRPQVDVISGSLSDPETVARAMSGVTHVIHMAAVKENPDMAFDVALRGMFLLLEQARANPGFRQFILIGGDCSVGHIFHGYDGPITPQSPRRAYPGIYALTKVLEEVMLEQVQVQYGLNGTILRAPWIMEKDDFRFALRFGPDQFGGPAWADLLPAEVLAGLDPDRHVPLMQDRTGAALKRNFIHVSDVVSAVLCALDNPAAAGQLFNLGMETPVDYGAAAALLANLSGLVPVPVPTKFHSNHLDVRPTKSGLGWAPKIGLQDLVEQAWAYRRSADDPRKVWYPG